MQQAIPLTIYARSHSDPGQKQWLSLIAISLLMHIVVLLWLSSHRPDFPNVTLSEFEVGLVASEGIGQLLQASPVATTASEIGVNNADLVLPEDAAENTQPEQLTEVSPIVSEDSPIQQQSINEELESATVITPASSDSPDVIPAHSLENSDESAIEQSRPVDTIEIEVAPAVAIESEITEAGISGSEVQDAPLVDEFFQPATIVSEDPVASLPIEEVAGVAPPLEVVLQNNPELANDSVEILQIKAVDVSLRHRVPTRPESSQLSRASETSGQHPEQNAIARTDADASSLGLAGAENNEQPLVIPRTYIISLKEWLSKYKQYPPEAYQLGQEGVTIIGLTIDRAGEVLSYSIKRSSGFPLLDQAVENMIDSAPNMPALPDDFPRDSLELLIPVRFKVN